MMTVTGIFRGFRTEQKDPTKPAKIFVGVAVEKPNGFPGEEHIHELRLPKEQSNAAFMQKFQPMLDQEVSVPFFITSRAWKDRAYVDFYVAGEPQLLGKPNVEPLKKAG